MQMVAYIGKVGVIHYEMKLGSNKYQHSNEFVRNTLRKFADVSKVVVVLYNTPCNARGELVFQGPEFAAATLLRLDPTHICSTLLRMCSQLSSRL